MPAEGGRNRLAERALCQCEGDGGEFGNREFGATDEPQLDAVGVHVIGLGGNRHELGAFYEPAMDVFGGVALGDDDLLKIALLGRRKLVQALVIGATQSVVVDGDLADQVVHVKNDGRHRPGFRGREAGSVVLVIAPQLAFVRSADRRRFGIGHERRLRHPALLAEAVDQVHERRRRLGELRQTPQNLKARNIGPQDRLVALGRQSFDAQRLFVEKRIELAKPVLKGRI